MDRDGLLGIGYPRAVLVTLALVTLVAVVVAASTSTAAFGAYNRAWDGAADLRATAEATGADPEIVRNVSRYGSVPASGTVAVLLSPDRPYAPDEAAHLRRFVASGGTLVVAEDFGPHANVLLADLGARARVDGRLLRDERYYYRSPAMPVARNVSNGSLTAGVGALTLNHGTAVAPNGARVLVATSGYAYPDANRNGDLDGNESLGTYPVATAEDVGRGRVIVLGDPSALINVMLDRPGNRAFVRGLFAAHERVVLDYSHAAGFPPLALALLVVRDVPALGALLGVAAVAAVGLWARWPSLADRGLVAGMGDTVARLRRERERVPRTPGLDAEAMVAYLERRHPDWDDERVRRVVRGLIKRRIQSGDDD